MRSFNERSRRVGVLGRAQARRAMAAAGPGGRFAAIAERAEAGEDATVACSLVGCASAREGVDLGAALDELVATTERAAGRAPRVAEMRALAVAWSEESLSYLHGHSCEDPITGMPGPRHMRARLNEVYRGAISRNEDPARTLALVVVETPIPAMPDPFNHALWWVRLSEAVRSVFCGEETMCTVGHDRLAVLVHRDAELGSRVAALRLNLADVLPDGHRVWIEGLPRLVEGAVFTLDELLRR